MIKTKQKRKTQKSETGKNSFPIDISYSNKKKKKYPNNQKSLLIATVLTEQPHSNTLAHTEYKYQLYIGVASQFFVLFCSD